MLGMMQDGVLSATKPPRLYFRTIPHSRPNKYEKSFRNTLLKSYSTDSTNQDRNQNKKPCLISSRRKTFLIPAHCPVEVALPW